MSTTDELEMEIRENIARLKRAYIRQHGKAPTILRVSEEFEEDMHAALLHHRFTVDGGTIMDLKIERGANKTEVV